LSISLSSGITTFHLKTSIWGVPEKYTKSGTEGKKPASIFPKPMHFSLLQKEICSFFTSTPLSPTGAKKSKIYLNYLLRYDLKFQGIMR